jgi:ketosteroid isomerase-like protein
VRHGLEAWQQGDVAALAELLHPDVDLLWWTPGDWDCHGKDQVVALFTERASASAQASVDLTDVDDHTLLVHRRDPVTDGPEAGFRPATLVRFRDGQVVHMQQYRSREDALAGAASGRSR